MADDNGHDKICESCGAGFDGEDAKDQLKTHEEAFHPAPPVPAKKAPAKKAPAQQPGA